MLKLVSFGVCVCVGYGRACSSSDAVLPFRFWHRCVQHAGPPVLHFRSGVGDVHLPVPVEGAGFRGSGVQSARHRQVRRLRGRVLSARSEHQILKCSTWCYFEQKSIEMFFPNQFYDSSNTRFVKLIQWNSSQVKFPATVDRDWAKRSFWKGKQNLMLDCFQAYF